MGALTPMKRAKPNIKSFLEHFHLSPHKSPTSSSFFFPIYIYLFKRKGPIVPTHIVSHTIIFIFIFFKNFLATALIKGIISHIYKMAFNHI